MVAILPGQYQRHVEARHDEKQVDGNASVDERAPKNAAGMPCNDGEREQNA